MVLSKLLTQFQFKQAGDTHSASRLSEPAGKCLLEFRSVSRAVASDRKPAVSLTSPLHSAMLNPQV